MRRLDLLQSMNETLCRLFHFWGDAAVRLVEQEVMMVAECDKVVVVFSSILLWIIPQMMKMDALARPAYSTFPRVRKKVS